MKAIISAGGTGGHIYPALAIINKIKEMEPDSKFLYIGTHNRMEKDIVPNNNIPYEEIEIYGFNKKKIFNNFRTIKCLIQSYKKCKKLIKKFNPDIVIGVGGYVTVPVIMAAHNLGVKTFIHEQNSIPGKSNLFLSKKVNKIAVSFKSSIECFMTNNVVFTGNPCSDNATNCNPIDKKELGLSNNKKLVYIVMGSLGSEKITNFLLNTIMMFNNKPYEIVFVTGKASYDMVSNIKIPNNVKVFPYIDNQCRVLKKVDILVTRCGASTLSEIIALEIPSILIPSPYVANNHQYKNAMDLVKKNAALIIEEKNLKGDILVKTIDELINNNDKIKSIRKNIKLFSMPNSATTIYKEIKKTIDGK